MANNTPVGNIDFINPLEGMSALQRNWQIARIQCTGTTTSFSASTIYAVFVDAQSPAGNVKLFDNTTVAFLSVGAAAPAVFQMGIPTNYAPPGGAVFAVMNSSGLNCTILYK